MKFATSMSVVGSVTLKRSLREEILTGTVIFLQFRDRASVKPARGRIAAIEDSFIVETILDALLT